MSTPDTTPADKPRTTRHRINEVPGRTTPAPGQPDEREDKAKKVDQMIALMERPQGASLDELVSLTGWKDHSVRAFISRNLKNPKTGRGLPVTRKKDHLHGTSVYSLPPSQAAEEIEEAI